MNNNLFKRSQNNGFAILINVQNFYDRVKCNRIFCNGFSIIKHISRIYCRAGDFHFHLFIDRRREPTKVYAKSGSRPLMEFPVHSHTRTEPHRQLPDKPDLSCTYAHTHNTAAENIFVIRSGPAQKNLQQQLPIKRQTK